MSRLHRPLLALAGAMAILTIVGIVGLLIDPRMVTGAPLWAKPVKFSLSVMIYSLTLSWLLGMLGRWRRLAWTIGTVVAIGLLIEMVIIVGAAALGDTSHFNVSTPFHATLWAIMAVSISIVWGATILVAILLFRTPLGDRARSFAIRSGVVLAVIGMGLAFLMTGPQGDQITNYAGIIGAHTVGAPDGGPGIPILGWSTSAGDLRIPHFVGMHALQLLPLAALALEALSPSVPALRSDVVRARLLGVAAIAYAGILAILTVQALAGESIAHPSTLTIAVSVSLLGVSVLAAVVLATRERRRDVIYAPNV